MRGTWIEINSAPHFVHFITSSLMRGTWIEIVLNKIGFISHSLSSLMRGTWIEMNPFGRAREITRSSLMRGTWIEISMPRQSAQEY